MLTQYETTHLDEILGGVGGWYTACLLRLIVKADKHDRALLAEVYPEEVALVNEYQGIAGQF